MDIKQKYIA